MTIDKIKHYLGDHLFDFIAKGNKEQLEKHKAALEDELKRINADASERNISLGNKGTKRLHLLNVELEFINYRLKP